MQPDFDAFTSPVELIHLRDRGGNWELRRDDPVIREGAVSLYLNGQFFYATEALPEHVRELAWGILTACGFWEDYSPRASLVGMQPSRGGSRLDIDLPFPHRLQAPREAMRAFSSRILLEGWNPPAPGKDGSPSRIKAEAIFSGIEELSRSPSLYRCTGGTHSAGLADSCGQLFFQYEDISRRSAVDKVLGAAVSGPGAVSLTNTILLSSGRISSDIVSRAARAGVSCIASISAPSDRALELARLCGISVCGFVRGDGANIYTLPERLIY